MDISFIIPVKDEEATIATLYGRIAEVVGALGRSYEVIFIDDGSTDGSWREILALKAAHPEAVQAIRFRRNVGKAAALTAGYRAAQGAIVFTMDADLQDDPVEIPRFLEKLEEGYDLVSGWKKRRHDPWHKVLPSRVFNKMISWMSGVSLHDHNCGFKCYRSEFSRSLTLYGEMHRMVPALAGMYGFRVSEIVVQHHPREHGQSKYGVKRFFRGFMDMCTLGFLNAYRHRPLHFMAGLAAAMLVGALAPIGLGCFVFGKGAVGTALIVLGGAAATSAGPILALGFLSELFTYRARLQNEERLVTDALVAGTAGTAAELPRFARPAMELRETA